MVRLLAASADLAGAHVLDLGCGEGKNAVFLARQGCKVEAWDISASALNNAKHSWPTTSVSWKHRDVLTLSAETRQFDIVVAYGLFHCIPPSSINDTISHIQRITVVNGFNVVANFNDRKHVNIYVAHPSFEPTLVPHTCYMLAYSGWKVLHESDRDLVERHPTNNIEHVHSMTRILARKEHSALERSI